MNPTTNKLKDLRLLVVHEVYLPQHRGGGEIIVSTLLHHLSHRIGQITFLTSTNSSHHIQAMGSHLPPSVDLKTIKLPHRYLFNFLAIPLIWRLRQQYDLILATTYNSTFPSWVVARLTAKPLVVLVLGAYGSKWLDLKGRWLGRVLALYEKLLLHLPVNKLIALSHFSQQAILHINPKLSPQKITLAYPGIKPTTSLDFKSKQKIVLFVGRLERQKGYDIWLTAVKSLINSYPDWQFVAIGQGKPQFSHPRYTHIPQLPHNQVLNWMQRTSLFCLPSRVESFGLVVAEAMANGCAVVSTVPLGFAGIELEPNPSVQSVIAALKNYLDDPAKALRAGRKNLQLAQRYSWDNFFQQIESALISLNLRE